MRCYRAVRAVAAVLGSDAPEASASASPDLEREREPPEERELEPSAVEREALEAEREGEPGVPPTAPLSPSAISGMTGTMACRWRSRG